MIKLFFIISLIASITCPAWSYHTFHDTGDLLEGNQAQIIAAPQFIIGKGSGANLTAFLDTAFNEQSNIRYFLGLGSADIHIGASYKWVPYPDYENQPALGLSSGFLFARIDGEHEFSLKLNPFISKKFSHEIGDFNAYASIPVSLKFLKDKSDIPIQITIGSKLKSPYIEKVDLSFELAFDVYRSFSYISFGAIYFINDKNEFL